MQRSEKEEADYVGPPEFFRQHDQFYFSFNCMDAGCCNVNRLELILVYFRVTAFISTPFFSFIASLLPPSLNFILSFPCSWCVRLKGPVGRLVVKRCLQHGRLEIIHWWIPILQPRHTARLQVVLEKLHRHHHSHYETAQNFGLLRGRFPNPRTVNPNLHSALWLSTTRAQNSPHSGERNNSVKAIWERQKDRQQQLTQQGSLLM